jgi:hypothetical protein
MRPINYGPKSPITALATAFADDVTSTGAALTLTALVSTDGLAHKLTLTSPGTNDLRGVDFAIVGTDNDGNAQTETLAGANSSSTVTSVKYWKSIVSITPSATMGGLTTDIGIAAVSLSATIPLEARSIVPAFVITDISGTIDYTLQECSASVFSAAPSTLSWAAISAFTTKTTDISGLTTATATGIRLLVNTVTNGATYSVQVNHPTQQTG